MAVTDLPTRAVKSDGDDWQSRSRGGLDELVQTNFPISIETNDARYGVWEDTLWASALWIPHSTETKAAASAIRQGAIDVEVQLHMLMAATNATEAQYFGEAPDSDQFASFLQDVCANRSYEYSILERGFWAARATAEIHFDYESTRIVTHSSPLNWESLIKILMDSDVFSLDFNTLFKRSFMLVAIAATGIIILGTARGIALGLRDGLHSKILDALAPPEREEEDSDDSGDEPRKPD